MIIGALITHHANSPHREQNGKRLPDHIIKPGLFNLIKINRVSLAQDIGAGPTGYSLRTAAEFLAKKNQGRYDLGARGKNPLNNRPFLGGPKRIDQFTKINPKARPVFDEFRDALVELNALDSVQARVALAAFLRVRMRVEEERRAAARETSLSSEGMSADELMEVCEVFLSEDAEGGRRGQAFAAAWPTSGGSRLFDSFGRCLVADPGKFECRFQRIRG